MGYWGRRVLFSVGEKREEMMPRGRDEYLVVRLDIEFDFLAC